MKKIVAIAGIFLATAGLSASAQDIAGDWMGTLVYSGIKLRIVFHINKTDTGYNSMMDSPDQGVRGLPMASTRFDQGRLTLEMAQPRIEYAGDYKDSVVTGTFKQGGVSVPMDLRRGIPEKPVRPQEPKKPYPYTEEEVTIENKSARVTLAGTLTLPSGSGRFPVAVLITGSGPQNRDEEILGHKPFLVIADALTRAGIAVLRYDDRGVAKSTGKFTGATTADFATDAEAAVAWLRTRKDINPKRIGLIGHSEGGLIAPMVAARDRNIRFIVLLAGPGLRGEEVILSQQQLIAQATGSWNKTTQDMVEFNRGAMDIVVQDSARMRHRDSILEQGKVYFAQKAATYPALSPDSPSGKQALAQLTEPWFMYFISYDPAPAMEQVRCPVLAMNGAKDVQVAPEENLVAIGRALQKGGNKHFEVKEFPDLNHLFQECKTGAPSEYGQIEQTFSPAALEFLTNWVVKQAK
jgi:pimeloyl-ACP methyl ester carboxylesterase